LWVREPHLDIHQAEGGGALIRRMGAASFEGAGGKLTSTVSSPIQVHGVSKVPARRAPRIGEHNNEVLKELGFADDEIDGLRSSGAIPGGQAGKNLEEAVRAR